MGQIINGKEIASKLKEKIKKEISNKANKRISSILVGNDGGSIYYQDFQEKLAKNLDVEFEKIRLKEDISKDELK